MEEKAYQECVEAFQTPTPPRGTKPSPPMTPEPTVLANIFQRAAGAGMIVEGDVTSQYLVPAMNYVTLNSWRYTETGGKRALVIAGAKKDDSNGYLDISQGVVIVMIMEVINDQQVPGSSEVYQTPIKAGPVRIVDANGMQLILVTASGKAFFFNVALRKFVSPDPSSPVRRASGVGTIVETGITPFPIENYAFENQWYKEVGSQRIAVFAGSEQQNYWQGVLIVAVTSSSQPTTPSALETYLTPDQAGPIWIVEAEGERLILATRAGTKFIFDVASRQFVSWPDAPPEMEMALSATPPLGYTPIGSPIAP